MTLVPRCCLILLAFAVAAASSAQDDGERSATAAFAAGTEAYAAKNYGLALTHFEKARAAGLDSAAVHYNIAVCHYRLEDYESARSSFSSLADRFETMRALAQYNLGLVAEKQNEPEAAEAYFRQALASTHDDRIQRLAADKLKREPVVEPVRWYRRLTTRLGYDDNVRLVSDEVALPSGQSPESVSTELWGLISGPLSTAPGFGFDASLYTVRYQDASSYDQDYLHIGAVYRWQWGNWLAESGPQLSYATLDGDGYEERAGVALRFRRGINARLAFRAALVHDEIDEGDPRFAFVAGARDWLELSMDRGDAQRRLTVSYAVESNDRGANIASTRQRLALRYRHAFNARWLADVNSSFRRSLYDDLAQPRAEDLTELSLGITRSLNNGWAIEGTVNAYDSESIVPFSYDRSRFALGVNRLFF
jgi:Tfp pilus assembly protein PilF